MTLNIRTFVAPGFGENAYIVWRPGSSRAACIDPGNSVAAMQRLLEEEQLTVEAILLTHAHLDHVEGVAALAQATGAPIHLHPADRPLYDHVAQQALQFGLRIHAPPPPDHELSHGQSLDIGGVTYDVRHVPGHSPGHVLLHVADARVAFIGDVVFQGSIGRTDLPGGDYAELIGSIREQVLTLPAETQLLPGHGPATTVGHERATNPFLIPHYGGGIA
jgi:hydroxyacylglutathione hydrolase